MSELKSPKKANDGNAAATVHNPLKKDDRKVSKTGKTPGVSPLLHKSGQISPETDKARLLSQSMKKDIQQSVGSPLKNAILALHRVKVPEDHETSIVERQTVKTSKEEGAQQGCSNKDQKAKQAKHEDRTKEELMKKQTKHKDRTKEALMEKQAKHKSKTKEELMEKQAKRKDRTKEELMEKRAAMPIQFEKDIEGKTPKTKYTYSEKCKNSTDLTVSESQTPERKFNPSGDSSRVGSVSAKAWTNMYKRGRLEEVSFLCGRKPRMKLRMKKGNYVIVDPKNGRRTRGTSYAIRTFSRSLGFWKRKSSFHYQSTRQPIKKEPLTVKEIDVEQGLDTIPCIELIPEARNDPTFGIRKTWKKYLRDPMYQPEVILYDVVDTAAGRYTGSLSPVEKELCLRENSENLKVIIDKMKQNEAADLRSRRKIDPRILDTVSQGKPDIDHVNKGDLLTENLPSHSTECEEVHPRSDENEHASSAAVSQRESHYSIFSDSCHVTATAEPTSTMLVEPTSTISVEPTSTMSVEPSSTMSVEPSSTMSVEPTSRISVEPSNTEHVEDNITAPLTLLERSTTLAEPRHTVPMELGSTAAKEQRSTLSGELSNTGPMEIDSSTSMRPKDTVLVKPRSTIPVDPLDDIPASPSPVALRSASPSDIESVASFCQDLHDSESSINSGRSSPEFISDGWPADEYDMNDKDPPVTVETKMQKMDDQVDKGEVSQQDTVKKSALIDTKGACDKHSKDTPSSAEAEVLKQPAPVKAKQICEESPKDTAANEGPGMLEHIALKKPLPANMNIMHEVHPKDVPANEDREHKVLKKPPPANIKGIFEEHPKVTVANDETQTLKSRVLKKPTPAHTKETCEENSKDSPSNEETGALKLNVLEKPAPALKKGAHEDHQQQIPANTEGSYEKQMYGSPADEGKKMSKPGILKKPAPSNTKGAHGHFKGMKNIKGEDRNTVRRRARFRRECQSCIEVTRESVQHTGRMLGKRVQKQVSTVSTKDGKERQSDCNYATSTELTNVPNKGNKQNNGLSQSECNLDYTGEKTDQETTSQRKRVFESCQQSVNNQKYEKDTEKNNKDTPLTPDNREEVEIKIKAILALATRQQQLKKQKNTPMKGHISGSKTDLPSQFSTKTKDSNLKLVQATRNSVINQCNTRDPRVQRRLKEMQSQTRLSVVQPSSMTSRNPILVQAVARNVTHTSAYAALGVNLPVPEKTNPATKTLRNVNQTGTNRLQNQTDGISSMGKLPFAVNNSQPETLVYSRYDRGLPQRRTTSWRYPIYQSLVTETSTLHSDRSVDREPKSAASLHEIMKSKDTIPVLPSHQPIPIHYAEKKGSDPVIPSHQSIPIQYMEKKGSDPVIPSHQSVPINDVEKKGSVPVIASHQSNPIHDVEKKGSVPVRASHQSNPIHDVEKKGSVPVIASHLSVPVHDNHLPLKKQKRAMESYFDDTPSRLQQHKVAKSDIQQAGLNKRHLEEFSNGSTKRKKTMGLQEQQNISSHSIVIQKLSEVLKKPHHRKQELDTQTHNVDIQCHLELMPHEPLPQEILLPEERQKDYLDTGHLLLLAEVVPPKVLDWLRAIKDTIIKLRLQRFRLWNETNTLGQMEGAAVLQKLTSAQLERHQILVKYISKVCPQQLKLVEEDLERHLLERKRLEEANSLNGCETINYRISLIQHHQVLLKTLLEKQTTPAHAGLSWLDRSRAGGNHLPIGNQRQPSTVDTNKDSEISTIQNLKPTFDTIKKLLSSYPEAASRVGAKAHLDIQALIKKWTSHSGQSPPVQLRPFQQTSPDMVKGDSDTQSSSSEEKSAKYHEEKALEGNNNSAEKTETGLEHYTQKSKTEMAPDSSSETPVVDKSHADTKGYQHESDQSLHNSQQNANTTESSKKSLQDKRERFRKSREEHLEKIKTIEGPRARKKVSLKITECEMEMEMLSHKMHEDTCHGAPDEPMPEELRLKEEKNLDFMPDGRTFFLNRPIYKTDYQMLFHLRETIEKLRFYLNRDKLSQDSDSVEQIQVEGLKACRTTLLFAYVTKADMQTIENLAAKLRVWKDLKSAYSRHKVVQNREERTAYLTKRIHSMCLHWKILKEAHARLKELNNDSPKSGQQKHTLQERTKNSKVEERDSQEQRNSDHKGTLVSKILELAAGSTLLSQTSSGRKQKSGQQEALNASHLQETALKKTSSPGAIQIDLASSKPTIPLNASNLLLEHSPAATHEYILKSAPTKVVECVTSRASDDAIYAEYDRFCKEICDYGQGTFNITTAEAVKHNDYGQRSFNVVSAAAVEQNIYGQSSSNVVSAGAVEEQNIYGQSSSNIVSAGAVEEQNIYRQSSSNIVSAGRVEQNNYGQSSFNVVSAGAVEQNDYGQSSLNVLSVGVVEEQNIYGQSSSNVVSAGAGEEQNYYGQSSSNIVTTGAVEEQNSSLTPLTRDVDDPPLFVYYPDGLPEEYAESFKNVPSIDLESYDPGPPSARNRMANGGYHQLYKQLSYFFQMNHKTIPKPVVVDGETDVTKLAKYTLHWKGFLPVYNDAGFTHYVYTCM